MISKGQLGASWETEQEKDQERKKGKGAEGKAQGPRMPGRADLGIGELVPGLLSVGEDLPEHNPEAPHITLSAELAVKDTLRRHPANG